MRTGFKPHIDDSNAADYIGEPTENPNIRIVHGVRRAFGRVQTGTKHTHALHVSYEEGIGRHCKAIIRACAERQRRAEHAGLHSMSAAFSALSDIAHKVLGTDNLWIPSSQWATMYAQRKGSMLGDLYGSVVPPKDQDGLGLCWAYACAEGMELLNVVQGNPYACLAGESISGPANGWRNQGGNTDESLAQATNGGCCLESFENHANSLSERLWQSGWQADAAMRKITLSCPVPSYEAQMTCSLLNVYCYGGLDWWGHEIGQWQVFLRPDGTLVPECRNTWGDWGGTIGEPKDQDGQRQAVRGAVCNTGFFTLSQKYGDFGGDCAAVLEISAAA